MLVLFRETEDPGLTSRASDTPGDHSLEFRLANGQVDEFPASGTVPFAEPIRKVLCSSPDVNEPSARDLLATPGTPDPD